MSTVCVFGSGGRTGQLVVHELIKQGFSVVASVYSDSKRGMLPEGVSVGVGSVVNPDYVLSVLEGVNAVISVVGHVKGSDPLMQTKGTENIVDAMNSRGIRRIISLTGTGVQVQGDTPSLIDKVLNYVVGRIDPSRINDGIQHVKVLRNSDLDWTVLRVLKLSNGMNSFNKYNLTDHGPVENTTPRKKVAKILVDQVTDTKYFNKLPVSSK